MAKMRQSSSDGGSPAVLTECARCIDTCCFELTLEEYPELMASGCDAVVAGGGVPVHLKVLQEGPEAANINAAAAFCDITRKESHVGAMVAGGGVAALVEVLPHGPEDATNHAAWALGRIGQHEAHVGAVVTGGGVAALIKVLQEGPEGAKNSAIGALGDIAGHEAHVGGVVAGWRGCGCTDRGAATRPRGCKRYCSICIGGRAQQSMMMRAWLLW